MAQREYNDLYNTWDYNKTIEEQEKSVSLAAKIFLQEILPKAPSLHLRDRCTKYNNVTAATMYDALCDYTPPSPDDRHKLKLLLNVKWEASDNIKILLQSKGDILRDLAEMDGNAAYDDANLIQAAYMVVKNINLFYKACVKWKHKPAAERTTKQQFWDFFRPNYEVYDEKWIAWKQQESQTMHNYSSRLKSIRKKCVKCEMRCKQQRT